jgi:ribosomal protein L37E
MTPDDLYPRCPICGGDSYHVRTGYCDDCQEIRRPRPTPKQENEDAD